MLPLLEFSKSELFKVYFSYRYEKSQLVLNYKIEGPVQRLYSKTSPKELRKGKDLWKKTCLEAFFFDEGKSSYTELNFNILGEYCFIYFEDYRKEIIACETFKCLDINSKFEEKQISAEIHLMVPPGLRFMLSPTAILMPEGKDALYFALQHGEKPDFHSRSAIKNQALELLT